MKRFPLVAALLVLLSLAAACPAAQSPATVAEKSNFTATTKHVEVVDFCQRLAKLSPLVRLSELGVSGEGRKLPMLVVADPPVASAAEAKKSGKLVVLLLGNIHAGEVDGKEALLMLARDLATAKERPLLKNLVLLVVPNFNPDGGDKLAKTNRPWQAGPPEVGTRTNAQGFDLNRDFVKLESPEVRALVRCLNEWDPAVVIDTHTTNGSYHRYAITYDGPRHPATDARLCDFVNDTLLPEVGRRLEKQGGKKSYFYGNLVRGKKVWESYPAQPRYGVQYVGLRNRIAILSESYVYAPYRDRVLATRDFVQACLGYAADHRAAIQQQLRNADQATVAARAPVALRHKFVPQPKPVTILALEGGKTAATGKPLDVSANYLGRAAATLNVARPFAYLLPPRPKVLDALQRHGVVVEALRADRPDLAVEAYRIDKVTHAGKPFQEHRLAVVEATARQQKRRIAAGTLVVRTAQPLGTLAAFLLEPQSEDGLCTWNYFDGDLKEGGDYPVLRLPAVTPLVTAVVPAKPEGKQPPKKLTPAAQAGPNLSGFDVAPTAQKGMGKGGLTATSPDKKHVAFVRQNNLYVADANNKNERQLTKDGATYIYNGKAAWVYYEEIYNRAGYRAFWWSPDSKHIAFLHFDETKVPKVPIHHHVEGLDQFIENMPYPRRRAEPQG